MRQRRQWHLLRQRRPAVESSPAASSRGVEGAPASSGGNGNRHWSLSRCIGEGAAAVIPTGGARETAAARGNVFPTPPVDWTTAHLYQPAETATTQRRRYQVSPAVTKSGSRRTGMSGAFALLQADDQMVRSLATGSETDGDLEMPTALACDLETPGTYGRIRGAAERKSLPDLQRLGRVTDGGEYLTVMQPYV